jgi:hypothetical protein
MDVHFYVHGLYLVIAISSKTKTFHFAFYKKIEMKTSLINIMTMVSLSAILSLAVSSCSKENPPPCEEWEVEEERFNIGGCNNWGCAGSRTYQLSFCGDALKNANAGNIMILSEDQCCKKTLTFKRFIRKL